MEQLGNITLHCGDCLDLLRSLPDNSFDLAIVDPPYYSGPERRGLLRCGQKKNLRLPKRTKIILIMNSMLDEQNNLAYLLQAELLKTAEKFTKKCPKAGANVILGAGNLYLAGFLINAPTKQDALETLASCYEKMKTAIEITPDNYFGGGIRKNFNIN